MTDLISAVAAILSFGWNCASVNIPGTSLPLWSIPVSLIAVSLALSIVFRLVGASKSPPEFDGKIFRKG